MNSNPEDETYRKLKKLTYEDMYALCVEWLETQGDERTMEDIIIENGWTVDEWRTEFGRRTGLRGRARKGII